MYAKPDLRPLDATIAVSGFTPCPARYDSGGDPTFVHVDRGYVQVGDYGHCIPALPLGPRSVHVALGAADLVDGLG